MEVVRQVWAVVASARQVHSCRVAAEARSLTRSNVHRCRTISTEEEGRCRTARHELLKMMAHTDDAAALVRAWLPCTLRGNTPSRRTAEVPLISSPMLLSPLVRCSAPELLLGRWSLPASPGAELLMPRSPLL